MSLRDMKAKAVECLDNGQIQHELTRGGAIDKKNLLATGKMQVDEVKELIQATKGTQHTTSPHHTVAEVDVHILKPEKYNNKWYIKFYFLEPDIIFISVHESEE